jgi:hypothetical protein
MRDSLWRKAGGFAILSVGESFLGETIFRGKEESVLAIATLFHYIMK